MILILQKGKPIARVKMLKWGDENNTFFLQKKLLLRRKMAASKKEPVANYDQFASEETVFNPYIYSEENLKHLRQGIAQIEMEKREKITPTYKHP